MSGTGCEEYRELISAFTDERLEGDDLLRLERHVAACAACRAFEGELRRFRELLLAAEAFRPLRRPVPGFAASVAARIAREAPATALPFPARRPLAAWAGFAAAAAAGVFFFIWSGQRLVEPPPEGSMGAWMRQHTSVARDASILGPAEEFEFASYRPAARER
jgi:anti-sigma factor RsiW